MRLHHLCRRDYSFGKWKLPWSDVWDLIGSTIVWLVHYFLSVRLQIGKNGQAWLWKCPKLFYIWKLIVIKTYSSLFTSSVEVGGNLHCSLVFTFNYLWLEHRNPKTSVDAVRLIDQRVEPKDRDSGSHSWSL